MTFRALFALLLVLALPRTGAGQEVPSPYRFIERTQAFGVVVGYLDIGTGTVDVGPEGGLVVGARYSADVSEPLSLEGTLFLMSTKRDVFNPARDPGDRLIGEADSRILGAKAGVRFNPVGRRTWNRLAPYLTAQAGLAIDLADQDAVEDELQPGDAFDFGTSFLGEIGGGVRWFHSDRWSVRGEATLTLWQIDNPPGFRDPDRGFTTIPEDEWVSGLQLSVGVSYRF